jgi:hypothetical protein
MEYFVLPVCWHQQTLYLIYFSNDQDGVLLEAGGIAAFPDADKAVAYARKRKHKLQPALDPLDLLTVSAWAGSRSTRLPDASLLYRSWNFFGDVASSLEKADSYLGYDEEWLPIHQELFWGCNMPGISQSAERYEVDLSQAETRQLRLIMKSGLEIFQQGLK